MNDKKNKNISYMGEFNDSNIEEEYFEEGIRNKIKYIKPIVLFVGALYFLFIIPDYFLIKNINTFKMLLFNRIIISILIVLLYYRLKYMENYKSFSYWITAYETIGSISFLHIFYQYESPNFLIQSFGVMIIVLVVFLIPNRLIYMIFNSVFISTCFFILSLYKIKSISISEFSAAVIYILIVIILNSISSFQMNFSKRMQYLYSKELMKLSITDSLTQIYNRLKFDEELKKWINYSKRYNTDLSLILFDFDNFKKINDNYGHLIGDKVLIEGAQLVKKILRKTDIFARWGGEEFVILLPNTSKEKGIEVATKLKFTMSNYSFNTVGQVTCSFGVTSLSYKDDLNTMVNRVDRLLYVAKEAGKNTIIND